MWPLTTAPSMVAGRPVSIQSPARNSPGTPVRAERTRRLSRRHRERRPLFAHHDPADQCRGSGGRQSVAYFAHRQLDQLLVASRDNFFRSVRYERQMRRLSAKYPSLIEHPLERPAGQPDQRPFGNDAIEPEVHGHDRRRLGVRGGVQHKDSSAAGRSANTSDSACHGTAQMMEGEVICSPRTITRGPGRGEPEVAGFTRARDSDDGVGLDGAPASARCTHVRDARTARREASAATPAPRREDRR